MNCSKCVSLHTCTLHSSCMQHKVFKPSACQQCINLFSEAESGNSEALRLWKRRIQDLRARRKQSKKIEPALIDLIWASEEERMKFGKFLDPASGCAFTFSNSAGRRSGEGCSSEHASRSVQPFEGFASTASRSEGGKGAASPQVGQPSSFLPPPPVLSDQPGLSSLPVLPPLPVVCSPAVLPTPSVGPPLGVPEPHPAAGCTSEAVVISTRNEEDLGVHEVVVETSQLQSELNAQLPSVLSRGLVLPVAEPSWFSQGPRGVAVDPQSVGGQEVPRPGSVGGDSPASSWPSLQSVRLLSEDREEWFTSDQESGVFQAVTRARSLCPPAPVKEADPVLNWFCLPEGAEIAAIHPFKLRYKGLAFSSEHIMSKFLPGNTGAFTLIAPVKEALALPAVADLFEQARKFVPLPKKQSKQEVFQTVAKVFSDKVMENTGWQPDFSSQSFKVKELSEATRRFLDNPSLVKPKAPVLPWTFESEVDSVKNLMNTLTVPKMPLAHEKLGRSLQGAWAGLSTKLISEDACVRKVAQHHLTLHEGLHVSKVILELMAQPDEVPSQSLGTLCRNLAVFLEALRNMEEGNMLAALSGVVSSRSKMRAFVTQGMAPQSLVNVLKDSSVFSADGALFTEQSVLAADSIATEKFGLGFEPARGSVQAERVSQRVGEARGLLPRDNSKLVAVKGMTRHSSRQVQTKPFRGGEGLSRPGSSGGFRNPPSSGHLSRGTPRGIPTSLGYRESASKYSSRTRRDQGKPTQRAFSSNGSDRSRQGSARGRAAF